MSAHCMQMNSRLSKSRLVVNNLQTNKIVGNIFRELFNLMSFGKEPTFFQFYAVAESFKLSIRCIKLQKIL